LAAPAGGAAVGDVEGGLSRSELVGEKTAVSTEALAGLLEVRSLELDASTLVEAPHAQPSTPHTLDAVDLVLLLGEGSAERRIERTRESLLTHAVAGVIVDLVAAVLGLAAGRNSGRSVGALVVTVGSSDNNLEIIAALASVGGSLLGNLLSPDGALVVDNGGRVGARALVRVPLRVTLDVDVETSAGLAIIAELGAGIDIVAIESLVRDVATTGGSTLKVDKGLLVASRSLGPNSKVLVLRVVQETLRGVILGGSASTLGLRSTWVIRVDETAVGADLDIN